MTTSVQPAPDNDIDARRFHTSDAPYALPNDEAEWERLNAMHFAIKRYFGGNNSGAPFGNPKRILEIGAGSGIWAMELALEYPEAEVIACDISEIQSDRKPANCTFKMVNVLKEWPFEPNSFDIVHVRFVCVHLPHWPSFVQKAIEATAPGGHILLEEIDVNYGSESGPIPEKVAIAADAVSRWFNRDGGDARAASKFEPVLKESGQMSEVHGQVVNAPTTPWTDDPELNALGIEITKSLIGAASSGGEGMRKAGLTPEVALEFAKEVRDEKHRIFLPLNFVWGRKKSDTVGNSYGCKPL